MRAAVALGCSIAGWPWQSLGTTTSAQVSVVSLASTDSRCGRERSSTLLGRVTRRVVKFDAMADPVRRLESEALKLSRKARARLAERLISSLDDHADPDSERLWLAEAERRLDELLSGKVAGIPADEVFRKARSSLR